MSTLTPTLNPEARRVQRRAKANRAALWCLLALWLLWLLENFVGENNAWLGVLTYVPQFPFLLPPIVLLLVALRRCERHAAALNGLSVVFWLLWGMGFVVPLHWPTHSATRYAHLKVITFNILGGQWGVERVVQVVKRENPDVVCFQETHDPGSGDTVVKLRRALPNYHVAQTHEVATFSKFPIEDQKVVMLPDETGRAFLVTMLKIPGRGTGQFHRVRLVNVHFSALQIRDLTQRGVQIYAVQARLGRELRRRQINILNATTAGYESHPHALLVMGDFNTPPRGRIYRLLATRWQDAFRSAGVGFGHTYSSRLPLVRIDYIWTNQMFVVRRCAPVDTLARNAQGQEGYASDHRPLMAELDLLP